MRDHRGVQKGRPNRVAVRSSPSVTLLKKKEGDRKDTGNLSRGSLEFDRGTCPNTMVSLDKDRIALKRVYARALFTEDLSKKPHLMSFLFNCFVYFNYELLFKDFISRD